MKCVTRPSFGRFALPVVALLVLSLVAACVPLPPLPATPAPPTAQLATEAVAPAGTPMPTSAPSPGATALAQGIQSVYEDPAGRFNVPVPTNWKVEDAKSYIRLSDPDGGIKMDVVVVDGDGAEKGIAAAWAVADPAFRLTAKDTQKPPSNPGVDETVVVNYDTDVQQRIVQAIGQRVKDKVYVLLVDGKTDVLMRRLSQVQVIGSGLTIKGLEKVDLANVKPKLLTPEILAELDAYIVDAMARANVPGAEVAVVQNGKVVYLKGFGMREMGKPDPVTPDTLMMIGSTGKTMTTMMMATLVDDQRMGWDTPAVKILPSFAVADPDLTQKITMRNLVCACTGVPRRDFELIFNADSLTAEDIVKSLRTFQFFTKFGEAFQYSNQMVGTAGYVAAVAGGARPDDLYNGYLAQMQQRVFDPIGMSSTTFSFDKVAATPDHAVPHGLNLLHEYHPLPLRTEGLLRPIAPAGASWSNARDMARYLITELNQGLSPDGKRVVSSENLKVTWQPQVAVSADASYGLGWLVEKYKGLQLLEHGGNTLGFTSDLAFLPQADLGIVVLTNARSSDVFNQAVRNRLFELTYGLPKEYDAQFAYALDAQRKAVQDLKAELRQGFDAAVVAPYLGTFTNEALGDITLSVNDGKLTLDAGEFAAELRMHMDKSGKTNYVLFDGPLAGMPFEFKQDDAGKPIIVLVYPPDTYKFTRK